MVATMSILGLLNYDRELLDTFQVPEGINAEHVKNLIYAECADMEIRFPNPRIFKIMFLSWNEVQLPVWEELMRTVVYDYNPIHNYDRFEEWEGDVNSSTTGESGRKNTRTENGTRDRNGESEHGVKSESSNQETEKLNNTVTNTNNNTTDNQVTGFNGGALVTHDKNIVNGGASDKTVGDRSNSGSVDSSLNEDSNFTENEKYGNNVTDNETSNNTESNKTTQTHKAHFYGNIGVTTSQQMLEAQREVVRFRVEHEIVKDFRDYFCLDVYLF